MVNAKIVLGKIFKSMLSTKNRMCVGGWDLQSWSHICTILIVMWVRTFLFTTFKYAIGHLKFPMFMLFGVLFC